MYGRQHSFARVGAFKWGVRHQDMYTITAERYGIKFLPLDALSHQVILVPVPAIWVHGQKRRRVAETVSNRHYVLTVDDMATL